MRKKVSFRRVTVDKNGWKFGELGLKGNNLQELLDIEGHAEI